MTVIKWRIGNALFTRQQLREQGDKTKLVNGGAKLELTRPGRKFPIFADRFYALKGQREA